MFVPNELLNLKFKRSLLGIIKVNKFLQNVSLTSLRQHQTHHPPCIAPYKCLISRSVKRALNLNLFSHAPFNFQIHIYHKFGEFFGEIVESEGGLFHESA